MTRYGGVMHGSVTSPSGKEESMPYNEILLSLRKAKGKSRKEVAEAIGITRSAVAMYERGDRVPRDDIKAKLAAYYKRSVSSIFFAG